MTVDGDESDVLDGIAVMFGYGMLSITTTPTTKAIEEVQIYIQACTIGCDASSESSAMIGLTVIELTEAQI